MTFNRKKFRSLLKQEKATKRKAEEDEKRIAIKNKKKLRMAIMKKIRMKPFEYYGELIKNFIDNKLPKALEQYGNSLRYCYYHSGSPHKDFLFWDLKIEIFPDDYWPRDGKINGYTMARELRDYLVKKIIKKLKARGLNSYTYVAESAIRIDYYIIIKERRKK